MFCILIGGNTIARSDVIFVMTEKGLFIDNPTGDRVSVHGENHLSVGKSSTL